MKIMYYGTPESATRSEIEAIISASQGTIATIVDHGLDDSMAGWTTIEFTGHSARDALKARFGVASNVEITD